MGGCAPTVYLGFAGDDRHGTTLTTAWQVGGRAQAEQVCVLDRLTVALPEPHQRDGNGNRIQSNHRMALDICIRSNIKTAKAFCCACAMGALRAFGRRAGLRMVAKLMRTAS